MAGNKIFYVTRTEDESTQTAGAATKTRADKPQLLKIVGVDHAGNPNPATPEDNQIYATEEEKQEILLTSDTVQAGDLNPVTSDAVATYIANQLELSDYEAVTLPFTAQYDGELIANTTTNNSIELSINGTVIGTAVYSRGISSQSNSASITFKKNDVITGVGECSSIFARYYKLRDYSKRS